jgi:hypothetical protein
MSISEILRLCLQRQVWAALLISAGVVCIAVSLFAASLFPARSAWTTEQSQEYGAAMAAVNPHVHAGVDAPPDHEAPQLSPRELAEARARLEHLHAQLEAAQSRPTRLASILRLTGVVLAIAGAALALGSRQA